MRASFVVPPAITAVLVLALGGPAGCSSSEPEPAARVCVPGVTQSCLCVGGATGVQSCKDDGSGFGACDCGGLPKDTGTDSALDSMVTEPIDSALGDTTPTDTAAETSGDTATDSGSLKFSGATGTGWDVRTGYGNGPQGFSEYTPAGVSYFFSAVANGGGGASLMARYDIAADSWTPVLANPAGVENNKGLGWSGTSLFQAKDSFMYRYSIATNTWMNVASGLPGTFSSMHAHEGSKLYSMATDATNRIVVFDTVTNAVSYVPGPSGTVYHPRLAWDGATKAVYIAASADEKFLWSFTPSTGVVSPRLSIPDTSIGRVFCSDRAGHLYASGDSSSCFTSSSVWQHDTGTNTWKKIPDLPFPHGCNGACTVTDDGWLYLSDGAGKLARIRLL